MFNWFQKKSSIVVTFRDYTIVLRYYFALKLYHVQIGIHDFNWKELSFAPFPTECIQLQNQRENK